MDLRIDALRPLSRLLREAIAIFLGVAAALAGQAWFQARQDRVAEREFLQGVLEELVATENATMGTRGDFEQQRQTAVEIAVLLARPPTPAIVDSISRLAPLLSRYDTGTGFAAVDVLLAPENVRLVRDEALRSKLATFRQSVAELRAVIKQNADFALTEWRAIGIDHFDYRVDGAFWSDEPEPPPVSRHKRDGAWFADSPQFENLIDLEIAQYRNVLEESSMTSDLIPELRGLIGERLATL